VERYYGGARWQYWVAIGLTVFYVALGSMS
jgi:hypothetical protein